MARRDLRRHKVRALLTCVLVALPVVVATVAALASYNSRWDAEREARTQMGAADAQVRVSRYTKVRVRDALWLSVDTASGSQRRDRDEVDLAALLPEGSALVPAALNASSSVPLATGGHGWVSVVDFTSDMLDPLVDLAAGRAPAGPDDVALDATTADQLGLLDPDGTPSDDARIDLADGSSLAVTGVVASDTGFDNGGLTLVAGPESRLLSERQRSRLAQDVFVDLPGLTNAQLHDLVSDLAGAGVMMRPRDAILHPAAWRQGHSGGNVDVTPIVVGALCVLVGLLEVVLLVGAAFAVAARRQVRDLGLLAANGGAGGDVRRVLLAQGVVLGIGSSILGVAAGLAAFRVGVPLWERIGGQDMWRQEIDWRAVVVIAVLGSLTSVVAALLPGWNVGRLTPVAALSGRFPVRAGESKAHRGAFVLAGLGLALVLGGGWLTARAFAPRGSESPLGPYLAFLGLVMLVAGTVWATPYVVRQVARSGQALPLSGRYAFRDAGRHRFRSAAATMALTITIGAAVLAGFGFSTAAHAVDGSGDSAPNTLTVSVYDGEVDQDRLDRVEATIGDVVGGDLSTLASTQLQKGRSSVTVNDRYAGVASMTEDDLAELLGPGHDDALEAFRDGSVVLVGPRKPTDEAHFQVRPKRKHPDGAWTLPAVSVNGSPDAGRDGLLGGAFVSPETASDLGLRPVYGQLVVHADQPFTQEALDRLRVYGIDGYSFDPERSRVDLMQFSGLAAAGLLSALVVGVAVALASAESRDDVATLAAVGAGPWRRRSLGAMHGLFLGMVGCGLGLAVGLPSGLAFTQLDGASGVDVPWLATAGTLAAVLVMAPVAGWVVTPSRLRLTRRVT